MKVKSIVFVLLFATIFAGSSWAGEIEYTGRASVLKNDVRSAQKNSLNNAIFGGIKKYLQSKSYSRKGDITEDYLMFIDSYKILNREYKDGVVITTVHLNINDIILEEVSTYVTKQINTAVFLITGISSYVPDDDIRKLASEVFLEKQFSTKEQIPFEQELIDKNNRADIQTAFQSVSSQYLFHFKFAVKSFVAGESCTIQSDSSYTSAEKIYLSVPIIKTDVTIDGEDINECIMTAVYASIETALDNVRLKDIPSPGKPLELKKFELKFTNAPNLKSINSIVDTLKKKKLIINSSMEEFFDKEAIFAIECYFSEEDLAMRVYNLLKNEAAVAYEDGAVLIYINDKKSEEESAVSN